MNEIDAKKCEIKLNEPIDLVRTLADFNASKTSRLSELRIQKLDLEDKKAKFITNGWSTTELDNELTNVNGEINGL